MVGKAAWLLKAISGGPAFCGTGATIPAASVSSSAWGPKLIVCGSRSPPNFQVTVSPG